MTPTKSFALLMGAVPLIAIGMAVSLLSSIGVVFIAIALGLGAAAAREWISAWLVVDSAAMEPPADDTGPAELPGGTGMEHLGYDWHW